MILIRDNLEKQSNDPREIAELKSQGYVELCDTSEESGPAPRLDTEAAEMVDLDSMTYADLKKYAKAKGIAGAGSLKKAELLEVLKG